MIRLLLRPLAFILAIWLFCYFFYSLGKRKAINNSRRRGEQNQHVRGKRKFVESTPIDKDGADSKTDNR